MSFSKRTSWKERKGHTQTLVLSVFDFENISAKPETLSSNYQYSISVQCQQGHLMYIQKTPFPNFLCDGHHCTKAPLAKGTEVFACGNWGPECDYDLCFKCFNKTTVTFIFPSIS